MTDSARALRIQLLIGFMCVALVVYFLLLGRIAWRSSPPAGPPRSDLASRC